MRRVLSLLAYALFGVVQPAHAQINTEGVAVAATQAGWGGELQLSLVFAKGNVDRFAAGGRGSARHVTAHPAAPEASDRFWFRDRLLLVGAASVLRTGAGAERSLVANSGYAHVRYTRMHWLRLGVETFAQAQYDQFRLLRRRMLWGGGLHGILVHHPRFSLRASSSYMLERERRNIAEPNQQRDATQTTNHRWSNDVTLSARLTEETLLLHNTLYVQPRWDNFSDVQILNETTLVSKVTEHFSLNVTFFLLYDSQAPSEVEKLDLMLSNGVTASF